MAKKVTQYEVLAVLDYEDKHAEPGDIVSDLPQVSIPWLIKDGLVRELTGSEE